MIYKNEYAKLARTFLVQIEQVNQGISLWCKKLIACDTLSGTQSALAVLEKLSVVLTNSLNEYIRFSELAEQGGD